MVELLHTKLFIPRSRANVVSRPRLVERLNAGLDRKLALIAASAGFGKTTLLSEWIPTSARCVTWLALDEGDNDPIKFWAYFISALQRLDPALGAGALSALQSEQSPPINSILTALLNDTAAFPDTFSLVLDDYHLIDTEEIHQALIFLLAHMPQNMHLVISTRVDPPLPLARLRARDQMTELRANDLRFTADEASRFLGTVMGVRLSAEQVEALETRTEGWIAGLQIAGLSMQGREDVAGFINAFSGSHRHILGYLAEEVLNRQPPATLDFMLKTSLLDRLCGPLCDAVTGETGGQTLLENLVNANLFITPLDEQGVWYRYHHLFGEVLRRRLSLLRTLDIPALHRRAANWFEQADLTEQALRHSLAAQDLDSAARLVEKHAPRIFAHGDLFLLRSWLEQFPPGALADYPRLVLLQARILGLVGNIDEADRLIGRHPGLFGAGNLPADLRGELAQLQSSLARFRGHFTDSLRFAQEALELLPPDDYGSRATVLVNVSLSNMMLGEPAAAANALEQIVAFGESTAPLHVWRASVFRAWLDMQNGQLSTAGQVVQRVIRQAEGVRIPPVMILGFAHFVRGEIEYERNELDKARQSLDRAITHLQITIEQIFLAMSYTKLTRVLEAQGDTAGALAILESSESWLARMNMNDLGFSTILAGERALFWIRQGKLDLVAEWAEVMSKERGHPSIFARELGDFVRVRVYIALGKFAPALQLLDGLRTSAESKLWSGFLFQVYILRARIFWAQGNSQTALEVLGKALALGEAAGYLRVWLDEGETVRKLLLEYRVRLQNENRDDRGGRSLRLASYLERVLAAFPDSGSGDGPGNQALVEPLNEREREILKLIAAGYSNREIAGQLVIAQSTVKWYINNLYAKLGAKSRTRALALAREMELI